MKLKSLLMILPLVSITLLGCEKDLFDNRNDYTGDWIFVVKKHEFNMGPPRYGSWDTLYYSGKITSEKESGRIKIQYSKDTCVFATVNPDGTLTNFPSRVGRAKFIGSDKLIISRRWGGRGAGITHEISGTRK